MMVLSTTCVYAHAYRITNLMSGELGLASKPPVLSIRARFSAAGINFVPYLPDGIDRAHISGIAYRDRRIDLTVEGGGGRVVEFRRNGLETDPFLPADLSGEQHIRVRMME